MEATESVVNEKEAQELLRAIESELREAAEKGELQKSGFSLESAEIKAAVSEIEEPEWARLLVDCAACRSTMERFLKRYDSCTQEESPDPEFLPVDTAEAVHHKAICLEKDLQDWTDRAVMDGELEGAKQATRCLNRLRQARKKWVKLLDLEEYEEAPEEQDDSKRDQQEREEEKLKKDLETATILREALIEGKEGTTAVRADGLTEAEIKKKARGFWQKKGKWMLYSAVLAASIVVAVLYYPTPLPDLVVAPDASALTEELVISDMKVVGNLVFADCEPFSGTEGEAAFVRACDKAKSLGFDGLVLMDKVNDTVRSCTPKGVKASGGPQGG
ncbi:hypothetical protein ACFLU6_02545 [Acidobacteriota bacterium]